MYMYIDMYRLWTTRRQTSMQRCTAPEAPTRAGLSPSPNLSLTLSLYVFLARPITTRFRWTGRASSKAHTPLDRRKWEIPHARTQGR